MEWMWEGVQHPVPGVSFKFSLGPTPIPGSVGVWLPIGNGVKTRARHVCPIYFFRAQVVAQGETFWSGDTLGWGCDGERSVEIKPTSKTKEREELRRDMSPR